MTAIATATIALLSVTAGTLTPGAGRRAPPPGPAPPLGVLEHGPVGAVDDQRPVLKVRFDRPVVALGRGSQDAGPLFAIDPPFPGKAVWRAPDLLVFEPEQDPPAATSFSVSVGATLAAMDGSRLPGALVWRFETRRPRCSALGGDQELLSPEQPVRLRCSPAPLPAGLSRWIAVSAGGRPVAVIARTQREDEASRPGERRLAQRDEGVSPDELVLVRPAQRWPAGAKLRLTIAAGLRTSAGPLPMGAPVAIVRSTVPAASVLAVRCPRAGGPIEVALATEIDAGERGRIAVAPEVDRSLDGAGWGKDWRRGPWVARLGRGQLGVGYTVTVPAGLRDRHGQRVAVATTRRVTCPAPPPGLALGLASGVLEAEKPWTIGVEGRGAQRARLRAVVLDDELLAARGWSLWQDDDWARVPTAAEARAMHGPVPVPLAAIGRPVLARSLALEPRGPTAWSSVPVDLRAFAAGVRRPVVVEVEPEGPFAGDRAPSRALYHPTDLGLVGWLSQGAGVLRAVRLSTGAPVAGARISVGEGAGAAQARGTTDGRGLLWLTPGAEGAPLAENALVLAHGPGGDLADVAILRSPAEGRRGRSGTPGLRPRERVVGGVVMDRDLFRAGETIHFAAFAAIASPYEEAGLRAVPAGTPGRVRLLRGAEAVAERAVTLDEHGKAWGELPIPVEAKEVEHALVLELGERPPADGHARDSDEPDMGATLEDRLRVEPARLRVASYRPSQLAIELRADPPHAVPGRRVVVTVKARRHSGGAAVLAGAVATVSCTWAGSPVIPGHGGVDHWRVGAWQPGPSPQDTRRSLTLPLAPAERASGAFRFEPALEAVTPWRASDCEVALTLGDAGLRTDTASLTVVAHPTSFYLAAQVPDEFYPGQPTRVLVRALRPDGGRVPAPRVLVRLASVDSDKVERREQVDVPESGDGRLLSWADLPPGDYQLDLEAADGSRTVRTEAIFHVREPWPAHTPRATEPQEELRVSAPAKASVGESVRVRVDGAAGATSGLLAVVRAGVREVHELRFSGGAAELALAVGEAWVPGVTLEVAAVAPSAEHPAAVTVATADVEVAAEHRRLRVAVAAPAQARPGDDVDVAVAVADAAGRPAAGARVALWVVDEGVLALTGYEPPDLVPRFAPTFDLQVSFVDTFRIVAPFEPQHQDPMRLLGGGSGSGYGRGAGGLGGRRSRGDDDARMRFATTPFFAGDLPVDAAGRARARFTLPHDITGFRITAVASAPLAGGAAPARLGEGRARIEVGLPLFVRPLVAAQLRPGDEAEAALVVSNRSGAAGQVSVTLGIEGAAPAAVRATGVARVGPLPLAAGEERRIAFPIVAVRPGAAGLRFAARFEGAPAAGLSDAVVAPVVVEAEAPAREVVSVSGRIAAGAKVAVPAALPARAREPAAAGALAVTWAPSLGANVEDAVRALDRYPYGCVEQTTSRLVPFVAFAAQAERVTGQGARARVAPTAARLALFETHGPPGLAYWPGGSVADPFGTAWATLVIGRAVRAGLLEEPSWLPGGRETLVRWLEGGGAAAADGRRRVELPFALSALAALAVAEAGGKAPPAALDRLAASAGQRPLLEAGLAALALARDPRGPGRAATVLRALAPRVPEQAAAAHATAAIHAPGLPTTSPVLAEAALLWAFARVLPRHPLADKLARGLAEHRGPDGWGSTFENALVLLALGERAASERPRAGALQASLSAEGAALVPAVRFAPRDEAAITSVVELARLPGALFAGGAPLGLAAAGEGALYYTLTASYVAADAGSPADAGLRVSVAARTGQGTLDGDRPVAAGALVAMDVTVGARVAHEHVVVVVPLPAGLELVDLGLAAEGAAIPAGLAPERGLLVGHQELRTDRALLFLRQVAPGAGRHTVYARALVPGRFAWPAPTAEAMYAPEVRGRGAARRLLVLPP